MPRMRLVGCEMLGRRRPFGEHQAGRPGSELARPDRAQVRPELGRDEHVRPVAAQVGDEAGQTRHHAAETFLPREQHRPREHAEAARIGPQDREAGQPARPRIEYDHARTCRQLALERPRPAAEDHVDRVAVLQKSAGESQHRPLDTTAAEIIQQYCYAHRSRRMAALPTLGSSPWQGPQGYCNLHCCKLPLDTRCQGCVVATSSQAYEMFADARFSIEHCRIPHSFVSSRWA